MSRATRMVSLPDLMYSTALTCRYDANGKNQTFQAYSNQSTTRSDNSVIKPSELKTIGQAKTEQLGYGEKTDYFTTQGTIAFLKQESFDYPACANPEGCNKKVNDNGDGWLCEKCDRTWPAPIYRYIASSRMMGRADGQIHSPNQLNGPRWSDVDNGIQ
jgi:replication factor A1